MNVNLGTDVMSREQRSRCMSKIRGKDTKPEMMLRKALWDKGLRYRIHLKVKGRPDIAFPGKRLAIFVDGCFWHGCPEHSVQPKSNTEFWKNKIQKNKQRDLVVNAELSDLGWKVCRFWEHEVISNLNDVVEEITTSIQNRKNLKNLENPEP